MPACPKCGTSVEPTARYCLSCGFALTPAAPVAPAAFPAPPGYPYYLPPPKRDNLVWVVVVVVIVVVAVPVVLAAVLYTMVSGLIPPPGGASKPVVRFGPPDAVSTGERLSIASVSSAHSPSNFKVNLRAGTETGAAVGAPLGSGWPYRAYVQVGLNAYAIEWTDIGGEGIVSGGDQYLVSVANGTWPYGVTMTFFFLWSDGSILASVSWSTSTRPVVAFGSPVPSGSGETCIIASASQAVGPGNYRVNLEANGSVGSATAMPTIGGGFVVLTTGTGFYRVNWTDIGGEGTLNGGDAFSVTHTDSTGTTFLAMPGSTFFTFYLLWSDGAQIASISWTTT
ncbi:MAG TPA: zinc ribbon domain-containing protein [Thermoplasmata archaeon]|nr:zinc ribbon domain-containing protein [Thermoplasmata archaeon]